MPNDNDAIQPPELHDVTRTASRILTTILIAGLLAGLLDLAYAMTFHGLSGVPPVRILQAIASGLLGRDAYTTGVSTAVIGGALHFGMTTLMSAAFVIASIRFPRLQKNTVIAGIAYGLVLYGVMTFMVVPLSAALPRSVPPTEIVGDILAHVCLVGLPIAFIARRLIGATAANPSDGGRPA